VWTALALAFLPAVLAGPFGNADEVFGEGPPLAVIELVLLPIYLGLILAGFASWKTIAHRSEPASSRKA
jgi:hypothetical protein